MKPRLVHTWSRNASPILLVYTDGVHENNVLPRSDNPMKSAEVSLAPIHVVLWAIYPLVFLTILESLSYGLLVPVLPIATTEYMILLLSCGFYILRVLWCVFVYKETLSMSCRAPSYTGINPFRAMTILLKTSLFRRLSIVIALSTFVSAGLMSFRLYFFNTELGFNKNDNAAFLLVVGVASMLSQGLFLHPLIRFVRERGVVVISMASYAVMSGLYLVVLSTRSKVVVFIVAACSGFGDIGFAAISSLKSTHVSEQEQGRVQGALYAVRALASATGPLAYSVLYSASQGGSVASESSPFILSLALYVVATGVSCLLSKSSSDRSDHRISAAALDVSVDSPHHGPMAPLLSSEDIEDDSGDI
ncbi:hypothetical protein DYB32_001808 [Aphanomyces invadans]|uniref:Major facilitator superfamily (MFS) profile domain-containing protein n=1 Tax=Aphanomyces invadans TaxID=157072 RepID=A0A3R6VFE6_9STRA|nr:hypothetical protein DYB32_001808 [Aphanomyces invadans]